MSATATNAAGLPIFIRGSIRAQGKHSRISVSVPLLQLVVGDSPLNLNLQVMYVNGTFRMGTADCPISSLINVFIPGGNSTFGIYALRPSNYDVHASFTVSPVSFGCRGTVVAESLWNGEKVTMLQPATQCATTGRGVSLSPLSVMGAASQAGMSTA